MSVYQSAILPKVSEFLASEYNVCATLELSDHEGSPCMQICVGDRWQNAATLVANQEEICNYVVNRLGFFRWIAIMVTDGGKQCYYCAPWHTIIRANLMEDLTLFVDQSSRDGDLAKELLDSNFSGAIVTCDDNIVLLASPEIIRTANQKQDEIIGKSLSPLWADHQDTLNDLHRDLKRNLILSDYQYVSGTRDDNNEVISRRFSAREIRLVRFMGRICRMTLGVEIID